MGEVLYALRADTAGLIPAVEPVLECCQIDSVSETQELEGFQEIDPAGAAALHAEHARGGDPLAWLLFDKAPRSPPFDPFYPIPAALSVAIPWTVIRPRRPLLRFLAAPTMTELREMIPCGLLRLTMPFALGIDIVTSFSPEAWF